MEEDKAMVLEENIHLALHIIQVIITSIIIYRFIQNYREIKSNFNLGLILFAVAMLLQTIFAWSLNIFVHAASEVFLLISLLIFLRLIEK